eukprot:TRINITY_DN9539_c0_g1_i13.p1 TRINITY_DN9539_c0_g1~~TRINITY_DN9539_c0_g1_i13.p1  ORF type:complete len:125 (+),score=42.63 TRINITY_DN9539_c0_g1_i13:121-495(+)
MAEKKESKVRDNKVTITSQHPAPFYVLVAKHALADFDTIELHAMGGTMATCVSAADLLIQFGYAALKNTIIEQVEVKGQVGMVKRPKMRIVLTKSANFNKLMEKAEAIKKENEAVYNLIGTIGK